MITGTSPQGLRYAVRRSGRAVAYCALTIGAGTRDEAPFPVGIAHFVEHNLFRGTRRKSVGCHPDLFLAAHRRWDAEAKAASCDIIQCAIETDTPLEINDNGLRKKPVETPTGIRQPYPVREFWELARDMGAKVVTNSDAHRPKDLSAHNTNATAFAKELGIRFCGWEIDGNTIRCVAQE